MTSREDAAHLFRHARREAVLVLVIWFGALVWSVGYSYLRGYQGHDPDGWLVTSGLAVVPDPAHPAMLLGIPRWIVIGILTPWVLCSLFTVWFGLRGMKDGDLGVEAEEGHGHGH